MPSPALWSGAWPQAGGGAGGGEGAGSGRGYHGDEAEAGQGGHDVPVVPQEAPEPLQAVLAEGSPREPRPPSQPGAEAHLGHTLRLWRSGCGTWQDNTPTLWGRAPKTGETQQGGAASVGTAAPWGPAGSALGESPGLPASGCVFGALPPERQAGSQLLWGPQHPVQGGAQSLAEDRGPRGGPGLVLPPSWPCTAQPERGSTAAPSPRKREAAVLSLKHSVVASGSGDGLGVRDRPGAGSAGGQAGFGSQGQDGGERRLAWPLLGCPSAVDRSEPCSPPPPAAAWISSLGWNPAPAHTWDRDQRRLPWRWGRVGQDCPR